ncbi:MAG: histidinol-phosphate transaminase [Candidatus Erginobacter occultus]|nr:histidinol-phosphate transaminase [Candidatus Erginobacter occultus]
MNWFRDNIAGLEAYQPGFQPREAGFVKLNTNENPYPPSPRALAAVREIADDRLRRYPDPTSDRLREIIAEVYGFPLERIIAGNGSDELLAMALRCFAGEGDVVAYPTPSYSLFGVLARIQGAKAVEYELNENFGLPEDFFSAEAAIKLVASPNSPTGTVYPPATIRRLLEESSGVVLVDEAYVDFAEESCLPLLLDYPNLLVTRTCSKSYSLAGARVGYAFASEEMIAGIMKVKDSYNLNAVSAAAAAAALADREYFFLTAEKIVTQRERLRETLSGLGFSVFPSGANFLLCRPPGGRAGEIYEALLERKILVRWFDTPRLREFIRISVGTPEEMEILTGAIGAILSRKE